MRLKLAVAIFLLSVGCANTSAEVQRPFAAGAAPGQTISDWRDVVGCYQEGTWHFQLDSIPAESRFRIAARYPDARQVRSSREWIPDRFWIVTDRNTVRLVIDDGLHGSVREFTLAGDTLVGNADVLTDVVVSGRRHRPLSVRALRTACDHLSLDPRRLEILLDSAVAQFVADTVARELDPRLPLFVESGYSAFTSQDSVMIGNRVLIQRGLIWEDTARVDVVIVERGHPPARGARRRVYRLRFDRTAEEWLLARFIRGQVSSIPE